MPQTTPKPPGFDNFDRVMKKLIRVPKAELDRELKKYEQAKRRRKAKRQ